MAFILISALIVTVFVYKVIDKQYKIDQEDWDWHIKN
ncbi:hypothetical protein UFOVP27_2 [uncultured Caudovirales phage]|uniref:Uncharacterized protein n=1 Tax=uncultured Caudovirales phage TaxID=2100421 RepID=A0A6J5KJI4_9CAUD|nr:hypothetical protein UFOVP27_2 [uncultured Caudovirales phage]